MGFLLAVYVPLAFTTSYFCMNLAEINGGSWPLSEFWKTAILLTVATIVLPALWSTILRDFARQSVWRAARRHAASIFIGLGAASVFVGFFGSPPELPLIGFFCLGIGTGMKIKRILVRGSRSRLVILYWIAVEATTILCMVFWFLSGAPLILFILGLVLILPPAVMLVGKKLDVRGTAALLSI